jgi:aminopeptidase N
MWRFLILFLIVPFAKGLGAPDLRLLNFTMEPDFATQSIIASVKQDWICAANDTFSLLLQPSLRIDSVGVPPDITYTQNGNRLLFKARNEGRHLIYIAYSGTPREAVNPPWDGGMVWRNDAKGNPWLGACVQGLGASVWWPAPPDHLQEADSVLFTCVYPANLFFKGNGKLLKDSTANNLRYTTWQTTYPINLYNITVNIADYAHFSEVLERNDGSKLNIDYYPLRYNLEKAKKQFVQTIPMLHCFEEAYGQYPCQNDGFSVVETAYAGMEHQGAIAYGNGYKDGYSGEDYSGVGILFDFILIHESAHEWWGNSVTAAKPADFWMQEAFCTYAEMQYVKCRFGKEAAEKYIAAKERLVENKAAILSGDERAEIDMYAKGALMLHTLSKFARSDAHWDSLMLQFAEEHRFAKLNTADLINWFCKRMQQVKPVFFNQYLLLAEPPKLEVKTEIVEGGYLVYAQVVNARKGFELPVRLLSGNTVKIELIGGTRKRIFIKGSNPPEPDKTFSYFKLVETLTK